MRAGELLVQKSACHEPTPMLPGACMHRTCNLSLFFSQMGSHCAPASSSTSMCPPPSWSRESNNSLNSFTCTTHSHIVLFHCPSSTTGCHIWQSCRQLLCAPAPCSAHRDARLLPTLRRNSGVPILRRSPVFGRQSFCCCGC
jgi:hypothetical protein